MEKRKYIIIDNVKLAYTDQGRGQPVLMVHDFGTFSYTWNRLLGHLTLKRRYITLDLKGFGHSEKSDDIQYSTFHQSRLLSGFINALKLRNVVLVGHSFGGAVCLFALMLQEIKPRVAGLVLINSMGYFKNIPEFIEKLRVPVITSETLVTVTNDTLVHDLIHTGYFDKAKITRASLAEYASILAMPGAKLSLIKSARYITDNDVDYMHYRFNQLRVPTLIIWGENDQIMSVYDAHRFYEDIPNADLVLIPECGHFPQEECPEETAADIQQFLKKANVQCRWFFPCAGWRKNNTHIFKSIDIKAWKDVAKANQLALMSRFRKLRMRRLIDKWSLPVIILFIFVKVLQITKRLGAVAEENGWRAATRAYLRTEDSKFTLAVFRLDVWSDLVLKARMRYDETKRHVIERLAEFLKKVPSSHWCIVWSRFSARRVRQGFVDIVHTVFDQDGSLLKIEPYFDVHSKKLLHLTPELRHRLNAAFIKIYNDTKDVPDKRRPWLLRKQLMLWIIKDNKFLIRAMIEAQQYFERILSGTFISFEEMGDECSDAPGGRFADPEFIKRKHPGYGLLNILCRINKNYDEADLWFQFHHIPVDGAPMQEVLQELKESWGLKGEVVFPAIQKDRVLQPHLCSTRTDAQAIYHMSDFIDFRQFLDLRKEINEKFAPQLLEGVTIVSMLLWGMAHHQVFVDRKFLFTVDLTDLNGERRPGVVFIRPGMFFDKKDRFAGFLKYQREFNRLLHATRAGKSESYELLELYALTSPIIYDLTRRLMPRALTEFIGTIGVTMVKGADLFITPHSEIHTDGFIAFGNFTVPTKEGGSAGMVSIRGNKDKIDRYMTAIKCVVDNFNDYL
ncbi:MAG: alpha/beta hydrolase, partial [Candidatus Omnitrophica bacterium]|nr:alpha/beta hydrolase [Candidatus Omnitrophota bacterium]